MAMPVSQKRKSNAGRPPLFTDPDDLEARINEYFRLCDEGEEIEEVTKQGDLVRIRKKIPYTIEGIADHLGCNPDTIREYGKTEEFSGIVSRARNKVHRQWVEKGLSGAYNAKIAALCMASHLPAYRINQENTLKVSVSIEDAIKQIQERRQPALPNQHQDVIDIE